MLIKLSKIIDNNRDFDFIPEAFELLFFNIK